MLNSRDCLIIAYARPEGVRRLILSCITAGVDRVFVSLDGPANEQADFAREEILKVLHEFSMLVQINVRKLVSNQGVGLGVLGAIDWFFENVDAGVVLEDDLELSESFLPFICSNQKLFICRPIKWIQISV